eukprot:Skav215335  [mRNA]  locus=scaffold1391:146762:147447:+ [translate_table: standard]
MQHISAFDGQTFLQRLHQAPVQNVMVVAGHKLPTATGTGASDLAAEFLKNALILGHGTSFLQPGRESRLGKGLITAGHQGRGVDSSKQSHGATQLKTA